MNEWSIDSTARVQKPPRQAGTDSEKVILIHGFAARSFVMQPLRFRLSQRGFDANCWGYPSLFQPIDFHANALRSYLESLDAAAERFHIVAHSMGSIIVRAALAKMHCIGLRRIVFLAPPNAGSPLARVVPRFVKRVLRPVNDLAEDATSFVNSLDSSMPFDVGIIAGRYDLLVPVANTHLAAEKAHLVVNATHNSLLLSRVVSDYVCEFLRHGNFKATE